MAKLNAMPSQAIIDGFKGKIDFYEYMGIAVARKWPVWRPREATPDERNNQNDFARINRAASSLPVYIIDAYKKMAQGTPFTWKDLLVRGFMRGFWE